MSIPAQGAEGAGKSFQERVVGNFRHVCNEAGDPTDLPERRDRFCEEAMEIFQALDGTHEAARQIVDYVFGREKGQPRKEIGQGLVTLTALATHAGHDLMACGEEELARLWQPEVIEKIRRKRAARHGRGPLPGVDAALASPRADSAERPAGEAPGSVTVWEAFVRVQRAADFIGTAPSEAEQDDLSNAVDALGTILANSATPAQMAGAVLDSMRAMSDAMRPVLEERERWSDARFNYGDHREVWLKLGAVKKLCAAFEALIATPAPAATPGVPDSVQKAIAFAAEAEGTPNGCAARRYAGLRCLQWVETLLLPQADKQTEPPALRAVVEVYPDRTDTRLTFGDRIKPEPGVKAVQQAIAALTAEYEARGGCPVVGRQPAGQAGDAGIEATQITLGEGMVDITRIDHEGRTGVLFRPRKERIPFGEPGELPEGTYWPVKGDVVLWVSGEGPDVAIKALADLAPNSTRTGAAETEIEAALTDIDCELWEEGFTTAHPAMRALERLRTALAARPAAPEAQGADIEDRLSEILTDSQRQDLSDRILGAYMAPHGGLRLDNAEVAYLWTKLGGAL